MPDNIPLEIIVEIIKRLPVQSLIKFRSVSKSWKSLIENPNFIAHYSHQRTQILNLIAPYEHPLDHTQRYVSIVDDDSFPHNKASVTIPPLLNMLTTHRIVGSDHGVLCLYGQWQEDPGCSYSIADMAVLWNTSINKAVAVVVPNVGNGMYYNTVLGFGVCRETSDPKIVKIREVSRLRDEESVTCIPFHVEVFTLRTRVWRRPLYNNLPRKSIRFAPGYCKVVVDRVFYWLATNWTSESSSYKLVISFDMTSEEFTEVNLPDCLANIDIYRLCMSKLRESLVVLESDYHVAHVWMMDNGVPKSFTKLFTIDTYKPEAIVLGFRKSGELIVEIIKVHDGGNYGKSLVVYDPYSKHVNSLGINGLAFASSVYPYVETLLLLDHPDFIVYDKGKRYFSRPKRDVLKHTSKGKIFGFRFKWLKP